MEKGSYGIWTPLHKICVWTHVTEIKRKSLMPDSDWLKLNLHLIFLICVQTQILCNGATNSYILVKRAPLNNNNVPFLYSAYHIQMASLCARGIITPPLALMQPFSAKSIQSNKFLLGTHLLHPGVERDNCGQNALSKGVHTEWDSNPWPSDCKSRARTTTPQCSHM